MRMARQHSNQKEDPLHACGQPTDPEHGQVPPHPLNHCALVCWVCHYRALPLFRFSGSGNRFCFTTTPTPTPGPTKLLARVLFVDCWLAGWSTIDSMHMKKECCIDFSPEPFTSVTQSLCPSGPWQRGSQIQWRQQSDGFASYCASNRV